MLVDHYNRGKGMYYSPYHFKGAENCRLKRKFILFRIRHGCEMISITGRGELV